MNRVFAIVEFAINLLQTKTKSSSMKCRKWQAAVAIFDITLAPF